jgi:hypothetical protein
VDFRHLFTRPGGVKRVVGPAIGAYCRLSAALHHVVARRIRIFSTEATMRALTVITALLLALATLPASAEQRTTVRTDAEKKVDKEVDDAYRAVTRGTHTEATKVDPWSKVRPADTEKKPK